MNRQTTLQQSAVLLAAAVALCGTAALADDTPVTKAEPENTTVVIAKVIAKATTPATGTGKSAEDAVDPAVADALDSLVADNKLELDMRLADHKSVILAADR